MFFYNAFRALSFNGISGDYVEFGCHGGSTFALAYGEMRRHGVRGLMWAFDSFEGLPALKDSKDDHPFWKQGRLSTSVDQFVAICKANKIPRDRYRIVAGFYDQSLPVIGESGEPRDIALAYIDCDLYSSTKTVLEFLWPRLKHGMIVAFDDYFCYSSDQLAGERRALLETLSENHRWSLLPYVQFGWAGLSFVVEDRKVASVERRAAAWEVRGEFAAPDPPISGIAASPDKG